MLQGTLVYLDTPDPADAETVRAWVNDPAVNRWMLSGHVPVSAEDERRWYADAEAKRQAGVAYHFAIHAADDGRLLGMTGLEHADAIHRHAEVGIFVAPPHEWGKGFATDAIGVLLGFAFDTLGMHNVRICAFDGNERALALYRRLGFKDAGREREAWFLRGEFHDLVRLDMLEDEWRASRG